MGLAFINDEKKRLRLGNTVCLYRGEPVKVQASTFGFADEAPLPADEVYITYLCKANPKNKTYGYFRVKYTEPEFEYYGLPLGYMNYGPRAIYLSRNPAREMMAGLSTANISSSDMTIRYADWFASKEFGLAVKGEYPTLKDATEAVGSMKATSVAFDRAFAVGSLGDKRFTLIHRDSVIGIRGARADEFSIFGTKSYRALKHELDRLGVPNRLDATL